MVLHAAAEQFSIVIVKLRKVTHGLGWLSIHSSTRILCQGLHQGRQTSGRLEPLPVEWPGRRQFAVGGSAHGQGIRPLVIGVLSTVPVMDRLKLQAALDSAPMGTGRHQQHVRGALRSRAARHG
jgi:hypothetical protein